MRMVYLGKRLIFFLYFHSVQVVRDDFLVVESHFRGKIGRTESANAYSVSFSRVSDRSGIRNALQVGDILTNGRRGEGAIRFPKFAILFIRKRGTVGLVKIPRLDDRTAKGDKFSTCPLR